MKEKIFKKETILTVAGLFLCLVSKVIEQKQKEDQIKREIKKMVDEHFEFEES